MTSLRMIQALSAGIDGLDFASVPSGVEVFSNAGAYTDSAAEHAWGLALGVAKGVHA
jgi:phosphoglycerate dehydrogenase-like enzyme